MNEGANGGCVFEATEMVEAVDYAGILNVFHALLVVVRRQEEVIAAAPFESGL